jgi:protein TonB
VSDRSQSKVPIFVFVVGAILLGAAALLSVLVTVPNPGARTPAAVTADQDSEPKPAPGAANKVDARLPPVKPAAVTEPVNTGALAGPGPGHDLEPMKDETSPEPAAIATGEPAAAEPMSDADLAEIRAATHAAAKVAAAEAPGVQPDDQALKPSAEAETAEPVITAAAPHAANAGEPEASIAEPHAPASLSGAMAPPAKDDDAEKPSAPTPAAAAAPQSDEPPAEAKSDGAVTPNQAAEPTTEAGPEPSQPAPTTTPAAAADDSDLAAPAPGDKTTTEPSAAKPAPAADTKSEPAPPAKTEAAEITRPPAPSPAPEPDRASPVPVEAELAPPMPSKKVVEAAPEVPKPENAEAPPPPVKAASEDSHDKQDDTRSRQEKTRQVETRQVETRQVETKPGRQPMALGFGGGLFKPKAAPAPRAHGTSSRTYRAAVRAAVGRHKPRGVGRGRVTVTFSVGPMGALRGVSVARSSGNSQLDQAAVSAVRSAAPFPAPPSGAGQTYSLPIYFH